MIVRQDICAHYIGSWNWVMSLLSLSAAATDSDPMRCLPLTARLHDAIIASSSLAEQTRMKQNCKTIQRLAHFSLQNDDDEPRDVSGYAGKTRWQRNFLYEFQGTSGCFQNTVICISKTLIRKSKTPKQKRKYLRKLDQPSNQLCACYLIQNLATFAHSVILLVFLSCLMEKQNIFVFLRQQHMNIAAWSRTAEKKINSYAVLAKNLFTLNIFYIKMPVVLLIVLRRVKSTTSMLLFIATLFSVFYHWHFLIRLIV